MSNEKEPKLVMPDGERKAPAQQAMTREELYELLKPTGQNEAMLAQMATMVAEAVAKAVTKAQDAVFDKLQGQFRDRDGEWNVENFPERSAFNPKGDNEKVGGFARPDLNGQVFWVGTPMDAREMSREEIELANAITPGIYHNGQWKVINLAPGQGNKRALLVVFPCAEPDQRSSLPPMKAMLREMVESAALAVA